MASSLQYCFYPTWYYITYPTVWAKYQIPIYGSSYLYDRIPQPGDPDVIYAQGDDAGYNSVAEFYKKVCEKLNFNPFTVSTYYINDGAVANDLLVEIITSFLGQYEVRNSSYECFNPEPAGSGSTSDDRINYADLRYGTRGTNAVTGANFDGLGILDSRIFTYTQYTSDDGIEYDFEVWPDTAFENGTIDASRLYKDGTHYRLLRVKLFIYKHNDKYFWYIKLHNYTCTNGNDATISTRLDGYDIGHVYQPDNPYDDHQADGNEGGNGGFDNDSDPTPIPDLPSVDITKIGGLKLYKCLASDLVTIFSYLGSNDPGDSILKWYTNPIQAIMACYYLPYPVTTSNASTPITLLGSPTGANGALANQWQQWSLGSVFVDYSCGNCFLDFEPYSSCSIYLPFIGIRRLNMDEVVGKSVGVTYQFDNTSGACVAYVTVGGSVKYSYAGSCAVGIPLSQDNWGQCYIAAATAAAGALAGGIGAAGAAVAQGAGKLATAGAAAKGAVEGGGGLSSLSAKPTVTRSGSICGAASALAYPAPYLIIEYPDKAKVANPAPVTGLACGRTLSLGSLSGYNVIEHVHRHGIAATGPELEEIERLLYEGVVF